MSSRSEETLSLKLQQRIDSQCIGFEDKLRDGSEPTIEEFLSNSAGVERRELLFELLRIDLDYHRRRGTTPSLEDYLKRFAGDEETVQAAFETLAEATTTQPVADEHPERIARYEIVRPIGSGGFGVVYEGFDPKLKRRVAIKVQRPSGSFSSVELTEAQTIAKLSHPNIVPVFDVGSTMKYPCYIVAAFIDGTDLAERNRNRRLTVDETIELVASIADALDYAHEQGIIHRDVKPRNILIDNLGQAFLVDFGLALRMEEFATGPEFVGTPAYMSPEQARKEGHRVDGRSDLFSLGSILYELLTGRRPFEHDSIATLLKLVENANPPPLAESVAGLPRELQRVCSKAMARRAEDRYTNGREFAEDLRTALETEYDSIVDQKVPRGIVPRGLRSYGAEDADFFLQLLPGPRDRRGLSRQLKQILSRVESTTASEAFTAGIVFGPSGCGKSSLMKAGVLPRASARVKSVYFEATPQATVSDLEALLRQQFGFDDQAPLKDMLTRLRQSHKLKPGEKLVIVIDQFEQWLHVHPNPEGTELQTALRQCDGARVQCVIIVRDDFWFAINRFMRALEVPILEGTNSFAVDLFDFEHAQKILTSFGQAFEKVAYPPTTEQMTFVKQATTELIEGDNVSPVRLALFAEMMKTRDWTPQTLTKLGGAAGVGLRFFEETFDTETSPVINRHSDAIRKVLTSLLPEGETTIKGSSRSRSQLLVQCNDEQQLDEVVHLLDRDLRLITPVESDQDGLEPSYQLAHDYLVPSIRRWLAKYQKETLAGRAEARLINRTTAWTERPENQQLPGLRDYASIRLFTDGERWSDRQKAMMTRATRHLAIRWGLIGALAGLIGLAVFFGYRAQSLKRTRGLVSSFQGAAPAGIPFITAQLEQDDDQALRMIEELEQDENLEPHDRFRLCLARSLLAKPDVGALTDPETIRTMRGGECPNIVTALRSAEDFESPLTAAFDQAFARFRNKFSSDPLNYDVPLAVDDRRATFLLDQQERLDSLRNVARYAILLLHLGSPKTSQKLVEFRDYPERRSAWIYEFQRWHGQLSELTQYLTLDSDPALITAICLGAGAVEPDTQAERQQLVEAFGRLHSLHPDSSVHSASGFALTRWNERVPAVPAPPNANWIPTDMGFTWVRVRPGSFVRSRFEKRKARSEQRPPEQQTVRMQKPFLIADKEVSVKLFLQFFNDTDWPAELKPAPMANPRNKKDKQLLKWGYHRNISREETCPVQQVNFDDAILFCNWLSHKEGLQACYSPVKELEPVRWKFDTTANGYRLPTESEWEYAARAGTRTFWFCGQDEVVLQDYAAYSRTCDYGTMPCGSTFPNPWGLFDVHGNVREWCWDWNEYWPKNSPIVIAGMGPEEPIRRNRQNLSPNNTPTKVRRGGCFTDRAEPMRSDRRSGMEPRGGDSRQSRQGFRVVRNAE